MQIPLELDIWLQSYDAFVNTKNNTQQKNLNTVFANISRTISPTSDSFPLIMSHIWIHQFITVSRFNFRNALNNNKHAWYCYGPTLMILKIGIEIKNHDGRYLRVNTQHLATSFTTQKKFSFSSNSQILNPSHFTNLINSRHVSKYLNASQGDSKYSHEILEF